MGVSFAPFSAGQPGCKGDFFDGGGQRLLERYAGVDIDSKEYRKAAAQRVGLSMPDKVPLRAVDASTKYDVGRRLMAKGGIRSLKAQLYFDVDPDETRSDSSAQKETGGGMNDPQTWRS